ncbi:Hsp70 family protein [Actinoplanes sp. NPDC051851]|uniref:Hsp70 family protein n=1 Tax=Actinoplanes sp. NPDC051851 TaxID=3154753 RepID=UPI00342B1AFF
MDESPLHRVIGIDLGTTYSAVAAYNTEESYAEIIPDTTLDEEIGAATPSVVRYQPENRRTVVGHQAKEAIAGTRGDAQTIIEIKREMGAVFTADSLARFAAGTEHRVDDPVRVRVGEEWMRPQEISALILMKMKQIAEAGLGGGVHDAVVTVPAYFTERQKKATEEAALLAGLYPRQLIPEPTAAAIAYGVDRADEERQIYLVYDLGGGTFDVSIIESREDAIDVLATAGDQRLGGGDFDDALVDALLAGRPAPSAEDRLRLKMAAENAKRSLSFAATTTVTYPDGGTRELTRGEFEATITPVLDRSLTQVEEALRFAGQSKGVDRTQIDAILLVGGSTRIPLVKRMLLDHFDKGDDFVRSDADPDTLVARGAALVAKDFAASGAFDLAERPPTDPDPDEDSLQVSLITEHTLGLAVQNDRFDSLIPRGTRIPASRKKVYTNPDMAERIAAVVYQGEGEYTFENALVGTVNLDDIEPRPEGYHRFEVEYTMTRNGLLEVAVQHLNTGRTFAAKFERSTEIGRHDELAERRALLVALYDPEGRVTAPPPVPIQPRYPDVPDLSIPEPVPAPGPAVLPVDAVPVELRRSYRRIAEYLNGAEPAPAVRSAYAAFGSAIAEKAPDAEIEALFDRLETAYDGAR